jgi:hypothetical protein
MAVRIRPATEADIPEIVDVSMLSFDPNTDAISAHLFPAHLQSQDNEAFAKWSIARKSARLHLKNSLVMVAVDDDLGGKIVGFSMWFIPMSEGSEGDEAPRPNPTLDGIDLEALAELRQIMADDEHRTFGKDGSKRVWSELLRASCRIGGHS